MLKRGVAGLAVALSLTVLKLTPELSLFRTANPYLGRAVPVAFEPAGDNLYKAFTKWYTTPFHVETLDTYAIDLGKGRFAVTDAGGYNTLLHRAASQFVDAVSALLSSTNGTLAYVLLTHTHLDHVGGLGPLLKRFPDVKVVYHELEEPYLTGARLHIPPWYSGPYSAGFRLAHILGMLPWRQYELPAGRGIALKGEAGDLRALGADTVAWQLLPGHSPGHTVFTLKRSGVALAGDIADSLLDPGVGLKALPDGRAVVPGQPALFTFAIMDGADADIAAGSLCRLAADRGVKRVLPYHDATRKGYSRDEFAKLAEVATGGCKAAIAKAKAKAKAAGKK